MFDSEINSVFENAVARNPFEGLRSEYFRDKHYQEELQFWVISNKLWVLYHINFIVE